MADFPSHSFTTEEVPSITSERTAPSGATSPDALYRAMLADDIIREDTPMADTDKLSDERLREIVAGLEGYADDDKRVWYSPGLIRAAFTELLSRRTSTGEAVAWPGREFCEVAARNVRKLAAALRNKEDARVAADAAQAIEALLSTHPTTVDDAMVERAWSEVVAERARQISAEGWTPEHDDAHRQGELLRAAVIYLWHGTTNGASYEGGTPNGWTWEPEWWKPKDRHSNLVRAGALCLAERDRCIRLGAATGPADHKLGIVLRELTAALAPTTVDDAMVERVWEVVEPLLHPTIDRRSARATLTAALRSTKE